MKRDYLTSLAAEAAVICSYLWVFRAVAVALGREGFGEYAVARRALALALPLAVLGMDIAVARYVALGRARRERWTAYPAAAMLLCLSAVAILTAASLLFPAPIAELFYGDRRFAGLVTPLPVLLLGGVLHGVAYGQLRGMGRIQRTNLLLVLNQALVPLVAVYSGGPSVSRILLLMGIGWIAGSAVFLLFLPRDRTGLWASAVKLARFGLPRVPGDFLQLGLFALPAIAVAHVANLVEAGTIAFGVAAISMVGSALTPIGLVLLPRATSSFATGEWLQLKTEVVRLVAAATTVLLLTTVLLELFADRAMAIYLGPAFAAGAGALRILALAVLPWGLFMTLRSLLDARHVSPVNARNMGVAFAVFIALSGCLALLGGERQQAVMVGFVGAIYVLAVLTVFSARNALRDDKEGTDRESTTPPNPAAELAG